MKGLKKLADDKPILLGGLILFLALLLRINDIFILKLDQLWGEIFFSKLVGFILILVYVWLAGNSLREIGFHTEDIGINLGLGLFITLGVYLLSYTVEYIFLLIINTEPDLIIKAVDFKPGLDKGSLLFIWLFLSIVGTAFIEEGLFRGLLISKFLTRFSFWEVNILQAVLFGIWYLVWPVKKIMTGHSQEVFAGGFILFIGVVMNGFILGYMYLKTNSLWTSWIANVTANLILSTVHIKSEFGIDALMTIRGTGAVVLGLFGMIIIKVAADKYKLEEAEGWG